MSAASYEVVDFGVTKYGEKARKFILNGAGGVVLEVSDYGGKVVRLFTPDRNGAMKDVVVGFDDPSGWDNGDPYWGCIIGRYGNRIAAWNISFPLLTMRLAELAATFMEVRADGMLMSGARSRSWTAATWALCLRTSPPMATRASLAELK